MSLFYHEKEGGYCTKWGECGRVFKFWQKFLGWVPRVDFRGVGFSPDRFECRPHRAAPIFRRKIIIRVFLFFFSFFVFKL